jgi:hypothetical protein
MIYDQRQQTGPDVSLPPFGESSVCGRPADAEVFWDLPPGLAGRGDVHDRCEHLPVVGSASAASLWPLDEFGRNDRAK